MPESTLSAYLTDRLPQYLDDLRLLSGIDSGSYDKPGVDRVQDWLATRFAALGFTIETKQQARFGNDLLARRNGSGHRRILLLGHADTVYPEGTAAERPMAIDGDKILGPGTCDMKAGILAGIYAVQALDDQNWNELEELTFIIVSDEEISERHSVELLQDEGPRFDAILTLEAARENGDIVTSRKAGTWMTVEVHGKSAHAGVEPEKGISATVALGQILVDTFKLNAMKHGMTVNPGDIEGGRAPNIVADYARGHFDLRAWTNNELAELSEAFVRVCRQAESSGVSVSISADSGTGTPSMERNDGVKQLEAAAIAIAGEIGFPLRGAATGGGSDISFAGYRGNPGLDGLGPIGGLDHGPDEYIRMSSIVPRTELLARLIQRIGDDERLAYEQRRS
ncbi:M20 family metallopeptidase [soil metagenome]